MEEIKEEGESLTEEEEPCRLTPLLKQTLVNRQGDLAPATDILKNKIVALYYAASWCPPSKEFTPKLEELHSELVGKRSMPFEVVYVPCDKSEADMRDFLQDAHGDWWAVSLDKVVVKELRDLYDIEVIPKLIVVKPNGDIITTRGRKEVNDRGISAFRSWYEMADLKLSSPSKGSLFDDGDSEKTNCDKVSAEQSEN